MTQADERPLTTDLGMLPDGFGRDGDGERPWWLPLVGIAVLCLVFGLVAGRWTAPSKSDPADPPQPGTRSEIIEAGALLGPIVGAQGYRSDDDVERYNFSWPGQELTAPEPSTGDPIAWQWQLCDVPPPPSDDEEQADSEDEPAPLECTAVEDATQRQWASPPTNRTRLVRVIVTVDLGDDVQVRAVSAPIAAVDWPNDITPGDPPPEAAPPEPPASS